MNLLLLLLPTAVRHSYGFFVFKYIYNIHFYGKNTYKECNVIHFMVCKKLKFVRA